MARIYLVISYFGVTAIWMVFFRCCCSGLQWKVVYPVNDTNDNPCECQSDSSSPVCGTNNQTFDNFCRLRCHSLIVPGLGARCREQCPCPAASMESEMGDLICNLSRSGCPGNFPKGETCGTDNITYTDSCKFICAQQHEEGLGVQCGGACPCPEPESRCSKCPEEYRPVCGTNGVTYGNRCMFACARKSRRGLFPACYRECPCRTTTPRTDHERENLFIGHHRQAFFLSDSE